MRDPARLRLVVIAAVLMAGCASPDEVADAPTPPASPVPPTATEPGTATPPGEAETPTGDLFAFTAPTVDGGEIDASVYASGQVALWFWAPW
jgi:hypothetical protein